MFFNLFTENSYGLHADTIYPQTFRFFPKELFLRGGILGNLLPISPDFHEKSLWIYTNVMEFLKQNSNLLHNILNNLPIDSRTFNANSTLVEDDLKNTDFLNNNNFNTKENFINHYNSLKQIMGNNREIQNYLQNFELVYQPIPTTSFVVEDLVNILNRVENETSADNLRSARANFILNQTQFTPDNFNLLLDNIDSRINHLDAANTLILFLTQF